MGQTGAVLGTLRSLTCLSGQSRGGQHDHRFSRFISKETEAPSGGWQSDVSSGLALSP